MPYSISCVVQYIIIIVSCPPLTTPDDGTYNCTMGGDGAHVVGDTCTLTCDDGFEPSDTTSRQCDNDGSWSGSDPTCDRGETSIVVTI